MKTENGEYFVQEGPGMEQSGGDWEITCRKMAITRRHNSFDEDNEHFS